MNDYQFLQDYIEELETDEKIDYQLPSGLPISEVNRLEAQVGLTIPTELKALYTFSYTPKFRDYRILTVPEVVNLVRELQTTYGTLWQPSIVPVAYVDGVGDIVGLDLGRISASGSLVLDGFHELPPSEWQGICYGLQPWLQQMSTNRFEPFWL